MTQGYGPQGNDWQQPAQPPGQQPTWGQPSPASQPQNSQQPQWGQPTPDPEPQPGQGQPGQQPPSWSQAPSAFGSPAGGYPGGAGSGGPSASAASDPGKRDLATKIGLGMVITAVLVFLVRLGLPIGTFIAGASGSMAATNPDDISVAAGLSGLGMIVVAVLNLLLSLVLLALAIVAAIQFSGRGRIGAIVVIATIVLSVPLSWILGFIAGFVGALISSGDLTGSAYYVISGTVEAVRVLVVGAVLIAGSVIVQRWGKQSS
ncbi:hypothetical protein ACFQS2_07035 [Brachybacterium sp. GCM10030267]|uniref:hypothetical protein n=1 Tax=Brachybacterium sp. GCM10030267 TaxID=3273381 RepID=UPI003612ED1C